MPQIYVEYERLNQLVGEVDSISKKIGEIHAKFQHTVKQLDWDVRYQSDINNTANKISQKLNSYGTVLKSYHTFMNDASKKYSKLDSEETSMKWFGDSALEKFIQGGVGTLLVSAGYIGKLGGATQNLITSKTLWDKGKALLNIVNSGSGILKSYKNYKRIGRVVGNKKAMSWFAQKATGLKPLGRYSTAQSPITRFTHNLTNKTSPFNAQIKRNIGNFAGKNGKIATITSWATVAINGILNWKSNKEEQTASNGTMSDGRVIAETITETAIDTGIMIGASAVIGAAIAAVFPAISAGVLITAASGLVVAGVNAGFKAINKEGKTFTEWSSDIFLDSLETLGEKIGNGAKNAHNAIGKWFAQLSST